MPLRDLATCAFKATESGGWEPAGRRWQLTDGGCDGYDPVPIFQSQSGSVRIVVRATVRATKIFGTPADRSFRRLAVAQPGSPPRRLSERPEDQHGQSRERSRRAARPERPRWQVDAFGPDDTDAGLPPWAAPTRSGGTRHRGPEADPYGGDA